MEMLIYRYNGEVRIKQEMLSFGNLKKGDIKKCRYIECQYKWIALYIYH